MCYDCYIEAGSPKISNEKVKSAAHLIDELYATDYGCAGGYGHIVFDEWNIEDENVDYCISAAKAGDCQILSEETRVASLKALEVFSSMSEEERHSALALHNGFVTPD